MGINSPLDRKLRMGLVGGGEGSFIGRVHSIAACLDNRAVVTAGALSSDPQRSKASAPDYDIDESRAYGSYEAMMDAESKLPEDQRIDFVSVTTPNHTHFEIARAAVVEGRDTVYPNVYDGVEGMYFIQQCVDSSKQDAAWLPLKHASARK